MERIADGEETERESREGKTMGPDQTVDRPKSTSEEAAYDAVMCWEWEGGALAPTAVDNAAGRDLAATDMAATPWPHSSPASEPHPRAS